ncbi:unnamed protein product [Schistosoma mattheei]|uniref:Uncharacterized protein n=1 Tax=Schistosoma mattheei TaxID=31246 RepID=A0AA85C266_9TREM|nr:unnamed protein product [Schistosoma mattheei]
MLSSLLKMIVQESGQWIAFTIAGLIILIASVIALVIALVKKINEKYPLNVALVIIYSICMATSFGVWNAQLDAIVKLAVFVISLVLFTCGLLIGAAIKTDLADHITSIALSLMVISVVTMIVAVVLSIWYNLKYYTIGVLIGTQILMFIVTIFLSYLTVGKSRYLFFYPNYALASIFLYTETTLEVMPAMVENLGWKNIEGINVMNIMQHDDSITVVSTYTKTVLILVAIQISVSFVIIMLSSLLGMVGQSGGQLIPSIIAGLLILIASVIALVIALVKKINEKYPLNVALVIIYSICMATALGVWNAQLDAIVKLAVFGISLVLFTCGLLIGAAIKTDLADHLMSILISFSVISVVIVIVAVVLSFWKHYKYYTIGVYIGAQIILLILTIFLSYLTVGKSRYLLLYPNYALASILLYTIFFSTLSINTDIINVNNTDSSIFQFQFTEH